MLKAVIFPQRGVELVLIGIKLFARHQFHKLVIAGALLVELRLDLLELVAHALELFVERGAGLGLGAFLLLGLFALGRLGGGGGVGLGGTGFGGLGRRRCALPCCLGGGAGREVLALVEVVVVVAAVDRNLAVTDVDDAVGHGAHQMLVVADQHDGAGEVLQGALEHIHRVNVQVVGGLVQAQERLGRHEHLGERQTRLFTAGEDANLLFDCIVVAKQEGAQQAALLRHGPFGRDGVDLLQDGVGLGHAFERVLGIVGYTHAGAQIAGAGGGRLQAGDDLHEGGLAGAVGADERHVLAAVELEVDIAVDVLVAVGLGYALQAHDHVAGARWVGELKVDVLVALGQDDELLFDLLDLADALLGLGGLGGLVAELVDEDLHVGDIALLGSTLGAHLFQVVLALLEIAAVVAGVGGHAAVLERGDVVDAGVHEGTVVADDKHGAVVVRDKAAQPLDAFEVQVVGGLVQKQQVGVAQEEFGERDTHLPAARELGARAIKVSDLKAQAGQDLARVALEFVAAQVLKAVLDLSVLVKECVDVLALLGELGDLGLQLVGALAHAADFLGGGHDLGEDGGVLVLQVGFLL